MQMMLVPLTLFLACAAAADSSDLGAVTSLTRRHVKRASRLVRKGKTYSLALETSSTTPAYAPRTFGIEISQSGPHGANKATFMDDKVTTYSGIGTQVDGFAHAGRDGVHYNGVTAAEVFAADGIKRFSTSNIPPIATRGILLDMAAYLNTDMVTEGVAYNKAEIEGALKRQRLHLRKGDVVIFHSGWHNLLASDPVRWISAHAGLGEEGARFLAEKGVVAVGADTAAVEVIPFERMTSHGVIFPVHQILLVDSGIYIVEGLKTHELIEDGVDEFMFVLGVPKLAGSVQAMINPIAIA